MIKDEPRKNSIPPGKPVVAHVNGGGWRVMTPDGWIVVGDDHPDVIEATSYRPKEETAKKGKK